MNHTMLRSIAGAAVVVAAGAAVLGVASAAAGTPSSTAAARNVAVAGKHTEAVHRGARAAATEQFVTAAPAGQFTAITPFRAWDTRVNLDDKVRRGDDWNVDMLTDYQGIPMIPATATAVSFNVTVTGTESAFGFVTIFNGDAPAVPGTSTINWALADFTIANGGIVALAAPGPYVGEIGVAMDGAADAAAEVIIDVTGYYTP